MIRLLIWGLLLYIGYRIIAALVQPKKPEKSVTEREAAATTYRDPVCGVYVSEDDAVIGTHAGERFHFCSMACLEKYREQLEHTSP